MLSQCFISAIWLGMVAALAAREQEPLMSSSSAPDLDGGQPTTADHWTPDRPDPFECEYMGRNACWRPSYPPGESPYMHNGKWPTRSKTCIIDACENPEGDDTPAIVQAFSDCGEDGHIVFSNTTYYIRTVLNTTGLKNVDVEVNGTLLWPSDPDFDYWRDNSIYIGFQNQTSAWFFGGENVHLFGHGYGTIDGNGAAWYDFNNGGSNMHGRPHAITISDTKNTVIEGLNFIKSQMWTMTVARSERVLLQDINVDNSPDEGKDFGWIVNTDGVDTVYADNITFLRWTIDNGDDSISMKQNSTNIFISNCTFYNGMGLAMGSIGQYPDQTELIENVTATDIIFINTKFAGRVKTWTGRTKGYPPNGGGGGQGHARNITFTNFTLRSVERAWAITQCTSYNGQQGDCDTSSFQISDMHWGNTTGTLRGSQVATLHCSGTAPCENIDLSGNVLEVEGRDYLADEYLCGSVDDSKMGFECTGDCDDGKCPKY